MLRYAAPDANRYWMTPIGTYPLDVTSKSRPVTLLAANVVLGDVNVSV